MKSDSELMSEFRALFGVSRFKLDTKEFYDWNILNNPYHTGKIYLEYVDDKIVGSTTVTPKMKYIFGERLLAAEIGDAYTHPEYQKQGIFSRGAKICLEYAIENGMQLIYGCTNRYSTPGGIKVGFLPSSNIKLSGLCKYRKPLPYIKNAIVSRLRKKRFESRYFFSLISTMLKQAFSFSYPNNPRIGGREQPFDIIYADKFDDEMDGLWGTPRFNFFTIRDRTYLNWRYFDNPDEYQVIFAKKGADYLGYIVTKLSKDKKIGFICDFISLDDRMDVFHALIKEIEYGFIKTGVDEIHLTCVSNSPYYQALLEHNYWDDGTGTQKPILIYPGTKYGHDLLEADGPWHFTLSDSDNI